MTGPAPEYWPPDQERMLKSFKIFLARRRIARWERRRGVLAFLGTWLPIWCALASLFWLVLFVGDAILLALPVFVIARYFIARRRADIVLDKIYRAMQLNHPLVDGLRIAGESDPGIVGVRLETLAELLTRGLTLPESLRLAVPEVKPDDLSAITQAEKSGQLLPELARMAARQRRWGFISELDASFLLYFLFTTGCLLAACVFFGDMVVPKLRVMFHSYQIPNPPDWPFFQGGFQEIHTVFRGLAIALFIIAGVLLRRLAIPFFRRGTVSIYIRDAMVWRVPILGSLIRCRSWSDGTRILAQGVSAGQPLPEIAQSAATAVGSRVARRRLRQWREKMLTGMPADSAARKSGLPRIICRALAQPLGSTGSALGLVAGYYDLKYRRRVEIIRAVSIPLAVLCMGALVLMLCLALYVPYVELLQVIGGGGG